MKADIPSVPVNLDSITGRSPDHNEDPMCDHCCENPWVILLQFTNWAAMKPADFQDPPVYSEELGYYRTRRLCTSCAEAVLRLV